MVKITGSHQRTCVFGTLSIDGKQLFRQYDNFDAASFLAYLKELLRKFQRCVLFMDKAKQHYRSNDVTGFMKERADRLKVIWLPTGSPEFNALEECWKQGKNDLLSCEYYPKFTNLKAAIARYYRTRRFNLDVTKYLLRDVW